MAGTDVSRFPRVGSAVIVVNDRGAVLLGRRHKDPNRGKWVLPGGKVRPLESLHEAGRREILEETGLDIAIDGVATVREIVRPPDEHRLIVFSRARPVGGKLQGGSDLADPTFFAPEELGSLDLSQVVRDVLHELGWIQSLAA
jgi:8-oxo-dGTP diphosphatase